MKTEKPIINDIKTEQVSEILISGNFDSLLGIRENDSFEAKPAKPYDLSSDIDTDKIHAIAELSSDVASFANQSGGYIVCGLNTPPNKNIPHDVVQSLSLFKGGDFYDKELIKGVLKSSVFPKLDIEVGWYPSLDNPNLGLGAIYIPEQDEKRKYFIVRVCELDGKKFKGFLGIPIRKDDQKFWLPVQEIYRLSKRAPNTLQELEQSISSQLQRVETVLMYKIDRVLGGTRPRIEDLLKSKIESALND